MMFTKRDASKQAEAKKKFSEAFEAALKKKLSNMPLLIVADDLKEEMLVRRSSIVFYGHEKAIDNIQDAFHEGVDTVYSLLLKLLETSPDEWDSVRDDSE